jgi:hypothetical protein
MPTYDFECSKCGRVHEIFRSISEGLPENVGQLDKPCCHGNTKVFQIYHAPDISVRASASEAQTLGQLAERNSKKLGSQVGEITEKYKTQKENTIKLKEGMSVDRRKSAKKSSMDRIKKINSMSEAQKKKFIERGD